MKNLEAVEIRVVANGFMVLPAHDQTMAQYKTHGDSVNVFETFEGLTRWLCHNLKSVTQAGSERKEDG